MGATAAVSVAIVTGWRYWRITETGLSCPLAGDPLPADGILTAGCHRPHLPPFPGCLCGVSYYPTAADVRTALDLLDLSPERFAVTAGTVERPTIADTKRQLYTIGARNVVGPDALRCRSYRVTAIYTETAATFAYNVPVVHTWKELAATE